MLMHRIAGNAGIQFIGKGGMLVISMITFSLLTRYLGPDAYGRYGVVLTISAITGMLSELGLATIVIRELASGRVAPAQMLPALLMIRLALSAVGVGLAATIGWAIGYDAALVALITTHASTLVVRGLGSGSFGLLAMARLDAYKNVSADAADAIVFMAIVAVGVTTHQGLAWFILGAVASAVVNSAVIILATWQDRPKLALRVDWVFCWRLVCQALPLGIAAWFATACFRLDAVMLSSLDSDAAAGVYVAAFKFVENSSFISAILMNSVFPVFSYCFEHDRNRLAIYYRNSLDIAIAISFSIALVLYLFADTLLLLLAGKQFVSSVPVLRICCPAIIFMFVTNVGAHLLFAAGQQKYLMWINLGAATIKIAANFFAIPAYGAQGAAATTALTEGLIAIAVFILVHRLHGVPSPLPTCAKLGVAALAIVGIAALGKPELWYRALLLAAWVGTLLIMGTPKPRHLRLLLLRK